MKGKSLHLTKGVHIVVPYQKLPIKNAVYFDAFDGRMIFAIPRGKVTYIGTSDTNYTKNLNRVVCTIEDIEYLLDKVNQIFKNSLNSDDVISSWAGLRPLIHEDGKSPSELSRKDEIFISDSGLISIAGGKLTGFRKMSEKVIDLLIEKNTSLPKEKCKTQNYKIHADSFNTYDEYKVFENSIIEEFQEHDISAFEAWYLVTTYGKNAKLILEQTIEKVQAGMSFHEALIRTEMDYTIMYESASFPDDFLNRRTGKLYFDIESITRNFDFIIGADGGHSKVREKSNLKLSGFSYDESWEIVDVELDLELNIDEGHIRVCPEGGRIMIR